MAKPQRQPAGRDPAEVQMQNNEVETVGIQRTESGPREGLPKALLHVLIAAVVSAGLVGLYLRHVNIQEQVRDLALDAKDAMARNGAKDLLDAEKKLTEALALDDDHQFVVSALALVNAQLVEDHGMGDRLAEADRFVAMADDQDAEKAERFAAAGMVQTAKGNPAEAEKMLTDVVNRGGVGAPIFAALGSAQRALGKLETARATLRRGAEMDWRNPRYNYWIAEAYFASGDDTNAAGFTKKALDANPDHLPSLVLRSRVDVAKGRYLPRVKETLADVLGRPERQLSPRVRGLALVAQSELARLEGRDEDALARADEAVAAAPELAAPHLAKGLALAALEREGALASIQQALAIDPFGPRAYHEGATGLLEGGQPESALLVMNAWGEKLPKDAPYHIAYGNLLARKGDAEAARGHYQEALELDPEAAEAFYRLGMLAKADKDYKAAVDWFNKAVQADEAYPEVYEAIGYIYLAQGHTEDGLRRMLQALKFHIQRNTDRETMRTLAQDVSKELRARRQGRMVRIWEDSLPPQAK